MNGISVMACVQTNQPGFHNVYGRESRIRQKYITISRQRECTRACGVREDSLSASGKRNSSPVQDRIHGRKVGHKGAAVHAGSEKARNKSAGSSLRKGKTGAGSRVSFFAIRTLVLAVIFACMLAGFQMMTRASSREKEQTYKYYTTVTIGYGEDLSDIVYRYCDSSEYENADAYVREVCDINSLPYTRGSVPALHPGAKIVIPYFSTVLK